MKIGAVILFSVLSISAPVYAFDSGKLTGSGSLLLDDLMPLVEKTPKLKSEIIEAISKIGKKNEKIKCLAQRFNGLWQHLAGERVAPYSCQIGDQVLKIEATVRLTGKNGKAFEKITKEAMQNAQNISETELRWKWTRDEVAEPSADAPAGPAQLPTQMLGPWCPMPTSKEDQTYYVRATSAQAGADPNCIIVTRSGYSQVESRCKFTHIERGLRRHNARDMYFIGMECSVKDESVGAIIAFRLIKGKLLLNRDVSFD